MNEWLFFNKENGGRPSSFRESNEALCQNSSLLLNSSRDMLPWRPVVQGASSVPSSSITEDRGHVSAGVGKEEIYIVRRRQAYTSLTFPTGLRITGVPFQHRSSLWGRDGGRELASEHQLREGTMMDAARNPHISLTYTQ